MEKTENIVDGVLSITKEEVAEFLEEKEVSRQCTCEGGELQLAIEADGSPSILKMGDVRDAGSEQWFYWAVCDNCCQSRFISAGMVWKKIGQGRL